MFKQLANKRSLMGLLYAFVLGIPLISVLVRTCYVTFNKNAYQSYSDTNGVVYTNGQGQSQIVGSTYEVRYNPNGTEGTYQYLDVLDGKTNIQQLYNLNTEKVVKRITIENKVLYAYYTDNSYQNVSRWYETSYTFYYVASSTTSLNFTNRYYSVYLVTKLTGSLDNAFEYSLQKVTQNNNNGGLNLVNWFGSLFLDINNAQNLLYLNFLNWYFNYVLMVSCVYLLFAVLMWFVNLARRLLCSFDVDRRL